jgi:Outer membrane protein beta-barrel domain
LKPLFFALAAALLCSAAHAQPMPPSRWGPPPRDYTANRHVGFFVRPDLGLGFMSASEDSGGSTMTISGASALGGFAVGGAVSENLIIAAHVFDAVAVNPNVSASGFSSSTSNTTMTMVGMGPEVTWYIMPENIYLSGTVGFTKMTIDSGGSTGETDWGFGARFGVGKEWWVSDHWGLGVAGQASLSSNPDPGGSTLRTWALGVAFSATYN